MNSTVIYGESGTGKSELADRLLAEAYGEGYKDTPDYKEFEVTFGTGMDDVRGFIENFLFKPSELPVTVVLVRHAERLSWLCQGMFLTELEREDRLYVFLSSCPLQDTIESRCNVVRTESTDNGYSFESCIGNGDVSDGEREMLRGFFDAVEARDSFRALTSLLMYEDKSGKSFFDLYKEDCFRVFRILRKLYAKRVEENPTDKASAHHCLICLSREKEYQVRLPILTEFANTVLSLV